MREKLLEIERHLKRLEVSARGIRNEVEAIRDKIVELLKTVEATQD